MSSWQFRLVLITATAFGGRAWGTGDVGLGARLALYNALLVEAGR